MKISVYIPSYNQKELLKEAIDSVLAQTLKPYEIIIVDDASTDGTPELLESYTNMYPDLIRYFINEQNQGVSRVRVRALSQVRGDYVTYVDGDDLFLPQKLEKEAKLIENGKYDIAFSNTGYFRGNPLNIQHIWISDITDMPKPGNMYLETFCRFFPRNSLFRMELVNYQMWREIGFHDTNLKIYEDYEMRIRLSKIANINYTLEPLALVRQDSHTLSKSPGEEHINARKYIFEKHKKDLLYMFPDQKLSIHLRIKEFIGNKLFRLPFIIKNKFKNHLYD